MDYINLFILIMIVFLGIIISPEIDSEIGTFRNIPPSPKLQTPNINPIQDLPPGFTDMHYKFNIKTTPVQRTTDYCDDYPNCYPCRNWSHIGPPQCIN